MTPQDFISKWGNPHGVPGPAYALNEEQGAQSHFLDLCELLGVPKPGSLEGYRFEEKSAVIGGRTGYADVFMPGVFAWENKAPGKNLDTALKQLLTYSLALSNPPILVVSDRLIIRIHTQFTGHPSETHEVQISEIDQPEKLALLRRVWTAPESFKPRITNRDITEAAAKSFSTLAEGLRRRNAPANTASEDDVPDAQRRANQVAHFLTQCLFCFFAEDVGLLPGRMFERLVVNRKITPDKLTLALADLFTTMQRGGMFGADDIPWFNGGLFSTIDVPKLSILDVTELRNAAELNWSAIDVSIFGTLFERGLDPAKRSQLGAHYTDTATIDRIIDPVMRRPLLQKWALVAVEIQRLQAKSIKKGDKNYREAQARFVGWLEELANYRVLDPACGSGNFLFLGLKALKDIEHKSHLDAAELGLDREADLVTGPHNVLGIELNEYAAELARVTVWIGELQWRLAHGYEFKTNPVLEPLDHIECRDALLSFPSACHAGLDPASMPVLAFDPEFPLVEPGARAVQRPGAHEPVVPKSPPTSAPPTPLSGVDAPAVVEAHWPKANIVIGNPPFLGDKKMRSELGDEYTTALRKTYEGRVPGGADLVCYWFEKARTAIESGGLDAAGLVATNSIRGGKNRVVLDAIEKTTRIYEAWSDQGWINDGAAVRVSLLAFGDSAQVATLDGAVVSKIHTDLSATAGAGGTDTTVAKSLTSNNGTSFQGAVLIGDFEIQCSTANDWLRLPNPHGLSNSQVLRPISNGRDINSRTRGLWVVDFGRKEIGDASLFEKPFEHVERYVKPVRASNPRAARRENWWRHGEHGGGWRNAVESCTRYIATSQVSKHRFFVWLPVQVWPHQTVIVFARSDDTTFGILHSRFHELWSLRMGTSLEDRPRYTPTTCFETYPFPTGLTPADTAHQRTETLPCGAVIPATPTQNHEGGGAAGGSAQVKEEPAKRAGDTEQNAQPPRRPARTKPSTAPNNATLLSQATAIAQAAKKLNDLRNNWLNPPEWTHKVPEVTPLGMDQSPYPDRIEAQHGISEADMKALQKRTLTNLYNLKPAWLTLAHQQLDAAVASAYGWNDYCVTTSDDDILKRLLALNLARSAADS